LYDDSKQESPLYIFPEEFRLTNFVAGLTVNGDFPDLEWNPLQFKGHLTFYSGFGKLGFEFYCSKDIQKTYPRVTGFKIYIRRKYSSEWFLQSEVDMQKGMHSLSNAPDYSEKYSYWRDQTKLEPINDIKYCKHNLYHGGLPRMIETYESETGFREDTKRVGFGPGEGYKTAVVANRTAYVGNVKMMDGHGRTQVFGDVMLKTPVGKFDSFTLDRKIEASIRDGDEIVKLEEYADRILQFKKRKMHLINISQDIEFLEDTFIGKGVAHQASTCKTDYGVAWVNTLGVYLYDGKNVSNLLEKGGRQIIKENDWDLFLRSDNTSSGTRLIPMIGYVQNKRQLIVAHISGRTADPVMYLYDMVTQSWVTGDHQGANTRVMKFPKTNFVNDWDGNLIFYHDSQHSPWPTSTPVSKLVQWNDTSQISDIGDLEIITKDYDFGHPGVRKKVYKVLITYKTNDVDSGVKPNLTVDYDVDGGITFPYDFADGTNFTSNKLDGANGWQVAELKPDVPSEANNIKSFKLRIAGATYIHSGRATAGSSTSITLAVGASADNDYYNGYLLYIRGGTGIGQARRIADYVGSTRVATVYWQIQDSVPDTSSDYRIGVTPPDFEINDISIIYRLKPAK
jgi:hypothetical protein